MCKPVFPSPARYELLKLGLYFHLMPSKEQVLFPHRNADLSALAQGRGFFRHGVEVECFIDDLKAYTLTVS